MQYKNSPRLRRGFQSAIVLVGLFIASFAWGNNGWIEVWDGGMINAHSAYQQWFERLDETGDSIDVIVVVRVRAFGRRADMVRAWENTWQKRFPKWDWWKKAGVYVSTGKPTDIPEVWMELRRDRNGNLTLPMHILGHEIAHYIQHKDPRVSNPDTFLKTIFELKPDSPSTPSRIAASPEK